jgi:hypothetical protein
MTSLIDGFPVQRLGKHPSQINGLFRAEQGARQVAVVVHPNLNGIS